MQRDEDVVVFLAKGRQVLTTFLSTSESSAARPMQAKDPKICIVNNQTFLVATYARHPNE